MNTTKRVYGRNFDEVAERAASYANRHGQKLERAQRFIDRAGWGSATFGMERVECADRALDYLNTGDTYSTTVAREGRGPCFVTSWGEWYEAAEQSHCEDENVIRCGYCGEFTDMDCEDWRDVVCSHCGNRVGG